MMLVDRVSMFNVISKSQTNDDELFIERSTLGIV